MKRSLAVLLFFMTVTPLITAITADTALGAIYKSVDKDGNVVYSDSRPAGDLSDNTEVELKPLTPLPSLSTPQEAPPPSFFPSKSKPTQTKNYYSTLNIVEPTEGSTLRNAGNFTVRVKTSPKLASGHKALLLLDGAKVDQPKKTLRFTVLNVDRGRHQLVVEIVDTKGRVIQSSGVREVFVQRAIVRPQSSGGG